MAQNLIDGDLNVNGNLTFNTATLPASVVTNAAVASNAAIAATKLVHQMHLCVNQAPGSAIVAQTADVKIMNRAGAIIVGGFQAAITGAIATDASRTVTVDLHKGNAGAGFATICSATIGFTNASVLRTPVSGTVSSPTLAAGDILRLVITVAGGAGVQAQGLVVSVLYQENGQ